MCVCGWVGGGSGGGWVGWGGEGGGRVTVFWGGGVYLAWSDQTQLLTAGRAWGRSDTMLVWDMGRKGKRGRKGHEDAGQK